MRITTVMNQKGGVGKTTTALALAGGLDRLGKRTLLLDLDPQANASFSMGIVQAETNMNDVLSGKKGIMDAIVHTKQGDVVPGSMDLVGIDTRLLKLGKEGLLKKALGSVDGYEYVIIDTPPSIGLLALNALIASDDMIIPLAADAYSMQGLAQMFSFIAGVRRKANRELRIDGLLMTKFSPRTNISRELIARAEQNAAKLGTRLYQTQIRDGVAVREAQLEQRSIFDSNSNPAQDYLAFIEEYMGVSGNAESEENHV